MRYIGMKYNHPLPNGTVIVLYDHSILEAEYIIDGYHETMYSVKTMQGKDAGYIKNVSVDNYYRIRQSLPEGLFEL